MAFMGRSLFDADDLPPLAAHLAPSLRALAERGVYFGTSSWKYPGWLDSIYTRERYVTRGKFSQMKFEADCLREYAETFPVVGGDFSFYQFPTPDAWGRVFGGTPPGFQFGLKVPEQITVPTWPTHARYGGRAGHPNEYFLDAGLFDRAFATVLRPYGGQVAVLMFEFGTLSEKDIPNSADFYERLDRFLAALPGGWRYAVEIRNKEYLGPDYFALLSRHGVAHVFNAWTRMPTVAEQLALPGAFSADFTVVRALLRHGRSYEQAVQRFEPYQAVREPDPSTREALRRIAARALRVRQPAFVFVNNRLEGNAPATIEAVVTAVDAGRQQGTP
jgi:uncharacterized protein YecE (DUF72 family)